MVGHVGFRNFLVAHFTQDGSVDSTFGEGGSVRTSFLSIGQESATGVALQADGKIVTGGFAGPNFALARFLVDGQLDSTFSDNGKVRTNFTPKADAAVGGVGIDPEGRIVAAGYANGRRCSR